MAVAYCAVEVAAVEVAVSAELEAVEMVSVMET